MSLLCEKNLWNDFCKVNKYSDVAQMSAEFLGSGDDADVFFLFPSFYVESHLHLLMVWRVIHSMELHIIPS